MMKTMRAVVACSFLTLSLPAQKLSHLQSLDSSSRPVGTQGVAIDSSGVYIVHLSSGSFLLQKLDRAGNELWTTRSGDASWVTASVTAAGGAVYVAGVVNGDAPGQAGVGHFDIYVARYDADGNQLWMRQFGTPDDDEGAAIAADPSGIYISSGAWALTRQNYSGSLRKYSPDGTVLWTRDLTALAYFWIPVATDGESLYLAASTGQDGKPWTNGQPSFSFLRKYTLDGREAWTRRFAAQRPGISGIAADRGGVYAVLDDYSVSGNQSSVRKYDPDGNELWASPPGALEAPGMPWRAIVADGTDVYVGGSVRTALPVQCYAGNEDAVVRKYDIVTGEEIWTREFGTGQPDPVAGLAGTGGEVFVLAGSHLEKLANAPVADSAARVVNECVLNAASNIGGGVVPGEIVTVAVIGSVTRVFFNGAPAYVLAASDGRIFTVVPLEVAGRSVVDVQVESNGIVSETVTLPVLPDRLGVFSADGSGNGQAAILNQDGTLNGPSNPARPGSAITIYGTGGLPNAIAIAISNEIEAYPEVDGGAEDYRYYAPILYAGVTGGLLQVNVQLPTGVPSGSAVPLHIRSGGLPIEQSLTIAIGH